MREIWLVLAGWSAHSAFINALEGDGLLVLLMAISVVIWTGLWFATRRLAGAGTQKAPAA